MVSGVILSKQIDIYVCAPAKDISERARLVPPQGKLAPFQPTQCQTQVAKERSCGKNTLERMAQTATLLPTETRNPLSGDRWIPKGEN